MDRHASLLEGVVAAAAKAPSAGGSPARPYDGRKWGRARSTWAVTKLKYNTWDRGQQVMLVLAAFLDDIDDADVMARAAADHGCRFVEEDAAEAACREMVFERLRKLREYSPRGEITFDSGEYEYATTDAAVVRARRAASDNGCAVELAAATEWREAGPVYFEGLAQSSMPLAYVSRCELPDTVRVCFGIYDRALNRRPFATCEDAPRQFRARSLAADGGYGRVEHPYEQRVLACFGTCSVIAFVVDENSDTNTAATAGYNTGGRGMMTLSTVPVLEPYDAQLDAYERVWACPGRGAGCSRVAVYELPAYPFLCRWSVARRVAFYGGDLLAFGGDGGALRLEAPYEASGSVAAALPEALGKLRRPGMDVGPWRRARVVNGTYEAFRARHCRGDATLRGPVFVARLLQPPNNQYHVLYSTLTALLAAARRAAGASRTKPRLFFDDAMGARRLFEDGGMPARERAQFDAIFDAALWPAVADGEARCFEELYVNTDERDGLNGFTHGSDGLVLTSDFDADRAPADSQLARSARALRELRRVLLEAFAPSAATAAHAAESPEERAGPVRVTVIERRTTRVFSDRDAVLDAVGDGCHAAARPRDCRIETVALEDLGYGAQIDLLSRTDCLVGVEGQGLANMLYLRPDAALVVLVPPGFPEAAVDYADAAVLLGLSVETSLLYDEPTRAHFGGRESSLMEKGYWGDATVEINLDPKTVASAVERALTRRRRRLVDG